LALYVFGFYAKLYTSDAMAPGTREAQEECWISVPVKVSPAMNERLIQDLSLEDITGAIKALSKGRAPGHDDILMEFFQEFEAEFAPTLLHACSAMLRTGATSPFISKGIITLIPKSGDRAKLNNWRPITLLGSLYKILAKTLASRLRMELTEIIRSNQTCFVEGLSILDNVFMAQEGLGWAEESNQDLVLLLLDFEKAFDKIEWGFLFRALEQLGFSQTWVHWVTSLYREATSAIKVNGVPGLMFQLARSMRQGLSQPYFGQVWG
jgi:mannosylglycoprotein endo-beta-mannosidase